MDIGIVETGLLATPVRQITVLLTDMRKIRRRNLVLQINVEVPIRHPDGDVE